MVGNQGCVLTGYEAEAFSYVGGPGSSLIQYSNAAIGVARIGAMFYQELVNLNKRPKPVLAGYCRQEFEAGRTPEVLTKASVDQLLGTLRYPQTLKEKATHLLQYLYEKGGKDGKRFSLQSAADYTLCYCNDAGDFDAVIAHLADKRLIENNTQSLSSSRKAHLLRLTAAALDQLEVHLAHGPMLGLTSQEIRTGNPEWDKRIRHAMDLFNKQPRTMESMRSAVIELGAVLEPIRSRLELRFGRKDTNTFFSLVNEFDVRHNRKETMSIEHEEQLEWLFYSFLNTLNAYSKLERKPTCSGITPTA